MINFYEQVLRPLLFSLDAEAAHDFAIASLRRASHFDLALQALKRFTPPPKPKTLFGLTFPNPIGLAAGLDKKRGRLAGMVRRLVLVSSRQGP